MSTFFEALRERYEREGEKDVLYVLDSRKGENKQSYGDLLRRVAGAAQAFAAEGIRPGEVIILIQQHGEGLISSFWGAVLHGAIPAIMPFLTEKLSPEHYRASLRSLFEITRPAAVVTYAGFQAEVRTALDGETTVRAVLLEEDFMPAVEVDFESLRGKERQPQDVALLQHSSGTTGLQKGVALSHAAVFTQLESYNKAIRLEPNDVIVSWLPLYHDMGLIAGFILPILSGTKLVLMSPFDWVRAPYRLMQAVSHYGGTLSWLPNFAYNFCAQKIRDKDLEGVDLASWRAVINCSEPMYVQSHQMFQARFAPYGLREGALATCYAMAENVFAVTQGGIGEPVTVDRISQAGLNGEHTARPAQTGEPAVEKLSAGKPVDGVEVRVLDDQQNVLAERQVGELAIRSGCMLTGYYNRPDLTKAAFHEGWYLTGDLGYLADGEVYITGRKKDLIIVGGKNIYPQDIETLVNEVPGVYAGRVAAFGVFNESGGTEDVVVLAEVETTDEEERIKISDAVRLAVNKGSDVALRTVELVSRNSLIKTSSGKVSRSANRERYLRGETQRVERVK